MMKSRVAQTCILGLRLFVGAEKPQTLENRSALHVPDEPRCTLSPVGSLC
jgi:hypothetical protein